MGMVKEKPRGFMSGLEQGISSALTSGWSGLKSVVDKPSEEFRLSGTGGFLKVHFKELLDFFLSRYQARWTWL